MEIDKLFIKILCFVVIDAVVIKNDNISNDNDNEEIKALTAVNDNERLKENLDDVFSGVYTECFLHLSYMCLQNKTLFYLKELNNLSEVSVFGDYVKFVKLNTSKTEENEEEYSPVKSSDELAYMIDKAVDHFFDNHVIKFTGMRRGISMSNNVEDFVGRKKRKGGGGGGHGGDDGGKKKMMMMAMMCMKMKLMMMVPAMMGMMGMMSFKGMMFSMMSFMLSKMMLLMKILEKKGGAGIGAAGAGGDGGWAASAGGGGAWMPAGGQDYAGGGYDANGQWQSRSIFEKEQLVNKPIISYVDPIVSISHNKYGNIEETIPYYDNKRMNKVSRDDYKTKLRTKRNMDEIIKNNYGLKTNINDGFTSATVDDNNDKQKRIAEKELSNTDNHRVSVNDLLDTGIRNLRNKRDLIANTELNKGHDNDDEVTSRKKRSLIDAIQNSYIYWVNKILGLSNLNRRTSNTPKYKMVNGIKYIYYPFKKLRAPKDNKVKIVDDDVKIIATEDFNKGEIMEGGVEGRMNKKKFNKMKDTVNDTIDENPWE